MAKKIMSERRGRRLLGALIVSSVLIGCSERVTENGKTPDAQTARELNHVTQEQIDALAATLDIQYTVLDNRVKNVCGDGPCFSARIDLTASEDFYADGWALYYSQLFPIARVESAEFAVETINGDLTRIEPTEAFDGFAAGETKSILLYVSGAHGNEYWPMPNYYIAGKGIEARTIKSTVPILERQSQLEIMPHLTAFTDPEKQFRLSDREKIEWATAEVLYQANSDATVDRASVETAIIPTPLEMNIAEHGVSLDLSSGIAVTLSDIDRASVETALDRLEMFGVAETARGVPVNVSLVRDGGYAPESYSLEINGSGVQIRAGDLSGAFYGLQSLASLVNLGALTVPQMTVRDAPRYSFRGLHLDVARNFHSKALVLKLLDEMAAYKLNKFHFHLGDDEGWRLEIPGLPELTEIGSKRCHDLTESACLLPQLGSGPTGKGSVNGYYTLEDYAEILEAAKARHIEVIPSFDMPGHSRAAVKSMEARYRRLTAEGRTKEAEEYLLTDFGDETVYRSIQNYTDNTINVCLESSFTFVEKVIDELIAMHERAGLPLTRYHIGADETAGAWRASPACKKFLADNSHGVSTVKRLGPYFIERISNILAGKAVMPAGWGDGLGHTDPRNMPAHVQSNAWGRLVDPAHPAAHRDINRGWDVVLSIPDVSYFDFPYEADPKERGYDWAARRLNTRKVFEYMPDNLPAHAEVWTDQEGLPLRLDDRPKTDEAGKLVQAPIGKGKRAAGIQAQLWSETMRSDRDVEYMAFPRLIAHAERAWRMADWETPYDHVGAQYGVDTNHFSDAARAQRDREWNAFANVIASKEMPKLDRAGIAYRIPTVGAVVDAGTLKANVIFPGLPIEYRVDGGEWSPYRSATPLGEGAIEVRATSPDGSRKGRILTVGDHRKERR